MPSEFYCEACGLVFACGSYGVRSRYPSRALLVCRACGTCHEVRRPFGDRRPPRLWSLDGPLVRAAKPTGVVLLDRRLAWAERTADEPAALGDARAFAAAVGRLACSHCHAAGTLTDGWDPARTTCPRCRADTLAVTCGWVT